MCYTLYTFFIFFLFFHLTHSRWTSSLPSCLWSQRIFPSLPGSRLTIFYRDASSALLQLVNQWLNFTYSRSHAFRYERKNTNPTLVRIELTTSVLLIADVQLTYYQVYTTCLYLYLSCEILVLRYVKRFSVRGEELKPSMKRPPDLTDVSYLRSHRTSMRCTTAGLAS